MPQNRKPTGRRSDRTKAAILAAAREQFAAYGYERATIRAIAAAAGIDPAMVMRYFGNKEAVRRGGRVRSTAARPDGRAARDRRLRAGGAFPRSVGER